MDRPLRVLHVIDALPGGGSERLLWDLVRLSNPERVSHRVATVIPFRPDFVFAERLQSVGAYEIPEIAAQPAAPMRASAASSMGKVLETGSDAVAGLRRFAAPALRGLPEAWKRPVWSVEKFLASLSAHQRLGLEAARFAPDVIHSHSLRGFQFGLALHYRTGKPFVHTITALFAQLRSMGWGKLISRYRHFQNVVDRWFIAEEYVQDLLGIDIPLSRIGLLRGGIDVAAIAAVRRETEHHRREIRRSLGLSDQALLMLSVGRWDPIKGHEHAVDALPRLVNQFPDLHWVALGHGWGEPAYAARARALGVQEHAHVVGYREDPLPYYAAADAYLRTTIVEADNLSSYNAMAMGIPVIGFDTGCTTELVTKVGNGILVRNADPAALADGVSQLLSLPDRGRAMGTRGVEYAAAHLDIATNVDEFISSYERVAERRPAVPSSPWSRARALADKALLFADSLAP